MANKKTFLLIQALLQADAKQKEELLFWLNLTDCDREEKVRAVKHIFGVLNIKELSEQKIKEYFDKAIGLIERIKVDQDRKEPLLNLFKSLDGRKN